jgi:hypothetical protein
VGCPDHGLGLLAGRVAGEECLSFPEARVGGVEGMLQLLPGGGRRLAPLGFGPPFQPGLLSPGEQQVTGDQGVAGLWE